MAVSKRLRYEILRRDGHTCIYCGGAAPDVKLTVDHVVPVSLGGTDDPSNLVAACATCNSGKSSINPDAPIVAAVARDALRWKDAMEACANGDYYDRFLRDEHRREFTVAWNGWSYTDSSGETHRFDLPHNWPLVVDQFIKAGLYDEDLADAVDIAMRTRFVDDRFSYFIGICWNQVRGRQEIARKMLQAEDDRERGE